MFYPNRVITLGVIALCILLSYGAAAQQSLCTGRLTLMIQEEKTGQPVTGAVASGAGQQAVAGLQGYCTLEPLCSLSVHLHVEAPGYATIDRDIVMKSAEDTVKIRMMASGITLDDVSVTGHKQVLKTNNPVYTLSRSDLDRTMGSPLAAMLTALPGVTMLQTGATIAKPVIHGMHSNRVLVLNNGIRQEGQQWGAEHAPEIDPFMAQKISVVKGAETVRYGPEAMGGVVIVEPPALPRDSTVHLELGLVGASNGRSGAVSGTLSGHLKKAPALSWRLQGTGKRGGNLRTADYFLDNTGLSELNYAATLGYTRANVDLEVFYSHFNTTLGIFSQSHSGSVEDLEASIANGRPFAEGGFSYRVDVPRQEVRHDLLKTKAHWHISDQWHMNVQYGFQKNNRREFDKRRGGRSHLPSLNFNLYSQTLDLALDYFDGRQWKAVVGINGMYQQNAKVDGTFTRPLIPDYNSFGTGAFAIARLIKPGYELEGGVRYDYKYLSALGYRDTQLYGGVHAFNNLSGSLGATIYPASGWSVRSNLGTAWRPPTINELYSNGLHHGAGAIEYGDSLLKSEQSLKWVTSLQYQSANERWYVDAEAYTHYFSNYIYLDPTGTFEGSLRGAFPVFQTRQANALFTGADIAVRLQLAKHWTYQFKGSVVNARNTSDHSYLPLIPAGRMQQSVRWQHDRAFFLRNSYLELTHIGVAHKHHYEAAQEIAPPPASYHLLNLGMGTQLKFGKQRLDIHISVDNLTNTLYKDYMNRFRYYAHDLGRNLILRLAYEL